MYLWREWSRERPQAGPSGAAPGEGVAGGSSSVVSLTPTGPLPVGHGAEEDSAANDPDPGSA